MRKAIRLALPVVAAATALALTGCNDDEEGAFGSVGGSSGGSEESSTEDPGSTTGGEETGDAGTTGGDTGSTTDGGSGGEVTTGPTIEELDGDWYESATVDTTNFEIDAATGEVLFYSSFDPNATDYCTGSYADGTFTLNDCQSYGGSWSDMSATVTEFDGENLTVTWSGGQTATMRNLSTGGFSADEQAEIGRIIEEYNAG
ncbi:hypothetical protein [Streptomyces sp. NPDC127098]|uniref:hypothetical protein n=1 Tax=Streptomyces sp. NPDC127098 TaxID=3347137 RepID=UPI0036468649